MYIFVNKTGSSNYVIVFLRLLFRDDALLFQQISQGGLIVKHKICWFTITGKTTHICVRSTLFSSIFHCTS